MRIVFLGTPEFAIPTLEAVVAAGHEVLLVVTRPDKPAGRHMELTAPAVVTAARRLGLPLAQPEKLGTDDFTARLRVLTPDAAVVVAFTAYGTEFRRFVELARIELRKVVWPTRQETLQTTVVVFVFVIVAGAFFWALDLVLAWATKFLTGQGS